MTPETGDKKSNRIGKVRCHNCFERFSPPQGAEQASCPECGWEWYISWSGNLAKIRKPVWDNWEQHLAEVKKKTEE